nr:MAG TPA: hypothetical protein [Caudoviricetes sp.]
MTVIARAEYLYYFQKITQYASLYCVYGRNFNLYFCPWRNRAMCRLTKLLLRMP